MVLVVMVNLEVILQYQKLLTDLLMVVMVEEITQIMLLQIIEVVMVVLGEVQVFLLLVLEERMV